MVLGTAKERLKSLAGRVPFPKVGRRRLGVCAAVLLALPPLLLGGEAHIRARLVPPLFRAEATSVYGRPLVLHPGMRAESSLVQEHLDRLGYRPATGGTVGIGEYYFGRRGWIIGRRPFRAVPDVAADGFAVVRFDYSGRIRSVSDEDGRRLAEARLEPELLGRFGARSEESRLPVALGDMPVELVDAVLTVEDQRYGEHHGLDYRRIAAAAVANLRAFAIVQGGSTVTQQLAKNLYLDPRRTLVRKLREASIAVALEARYTKETILEAYLNEVYFGQVGSDALHGVGSAAQHLFGKDVEALDLADAALLAGMIRAPNAYNPFRNPDRALERRSLVLRLMQERELISEEERQEAEEAPLRLRRRAPPIRSARYFLDHLARDVGDPRGLAALVTTLDPRLQRAAEEAVRQGLASLEQDFAWLREEQTGEPLQAALVALDPVTGEVLAMVGGRDYGQSQFNRATDALRQPGSAFKPVVALAAMARPERGADPEFTLASVLRDEPLRVETPVGEWRPQNYDNRYRGTVTLRDALQRSLNVPFARLGLEVGGERILQTARNLGIEGRLNPYPSIALGASEVTPLELTRAFGVLAAEGYRAESRSMLSAVDREGRLVAGEGEAGERVYDPAEVYLVTSALQGVVEEGTGQALRAGGFRGAVAGKSGTTNDFRDGWFVGYTPKLAVGVWVGFDHGARLEISGAGATLPIFSRFLEEAVGSTGSRGPQGSDGFRVPSGLEMVRVDDGSGWRGWDCRGEPELFLRGTAPETRCGFRLDRRGFEWLRRRAGEEGEELIRFLRDRLRRGGG